MVKRIGLNLSFVSRIVVGITMLSLLLAMPGSATMVTQPITNLQAMQKFCWGGTGILCESWTVMNNESGWFYGSNYSFFSNVDVYVYPGLTNPTAISDATVFSYSTVAVNAGVGDTVFFRGMDGKYGAWRIDEFHSNVSEPLSPSNGYLSGLAYFQDDGSGNFTVSPTSEIPEFPTVALPILSIIGLMFLFRRKGK